MFELLNPQERGRKRTLTNADLLIDVGIRPLDGKTEKPLLGFGQVKIPAGTSAGFLNGLTHKQLVGDLFLAKRDPAKLEAAGKKQPQCRRCRRWPTRSSRTRRASSTSCASSAISSAPTTRPARRKSRTRAIASARISPKPTRRRSPPSSPRSKANGRTSCRLPNTLHIAPVRLGRCRHRPHPGLAACSKPEPPKIAFAPYDKSHQSKMDLAQVDYKYPIAPAELAKITPDYLATLDQEQLDQIYARLPAGPIPDGAFDGRILLPRGESGKFRLSEIVGGFAGTALHLKGLVVEDVGETLWRGKVFFRDERVLRNRIEDLSLLKKAGLVEGEPKKMSYGGKETWLLFPAKLYCGQSLLDARRESIIIDYFFSDEIAGYQENPTTSPAAAACACATRSA
jgi:hypothetical protein